MPNSIKIPLQLSADYHRLLNETAHLLLIDRSPDELCRSIFEMLSGPFRLDFYFHFLVSRDGTQLDLASSGGSHAVRNGLGSHLAFGEAISGTVAQECVEIYLENVQERSDDMTRIVRNLGVCCYLCEPIVNDRRLIGTLSFGSIRRHSFLPEELEILRLVAQQVTLATERRLQADKMLEVERLATLGRMAATLAHEINNPLDSLTNILYLLRDEVRAEAGMKLVHAAESVVTLLGQTAKRTLDQCRGNQEQAQVVDLSELITEVLKNFSLPQHVPLYSTIEAGLSVLAVSGELRQVLFNLLLNAAQFSPLRGTVYLTVKKDGDFAEIRVKDEGPGISQKTQSRVFQPFYTTRTAGGTGLGLWLSREMVERVGGTLTFESNPDVRPGTEFIVCLPLLPQDFSVPVDES